MALTKSSARKAYLALLLMVVFGPVGNILLGRGMKQVGEFEAWTPREMVRFFSKALSNGSIWLGIGTLLLFLISYLLALSLADYSYVLPASGAGYVVVVFLGSVVLGERVTLTRWGGAALICLGVTLVGGTPHSTKDPE